MRKKTAFMKNWLFTDLDGSQTKLDLPHTWNALDGQDGGYSTFRVDVTDVIKDMNKIVVKVDNSKNDRVYPQMADFTFYGGIYRDVEWLVVNKDHFDLDYCGSKGLKITPEVKGDKAEVRVNTYTKAKDVEIRVILADAEERMVGIGTGDCVNFVVKK